MSTFLAENGHWQMRPQYLRAIRMDMGINMTAMALLLGKELDRKITRDRYREWERPKKKGEFPFVPESIAETAEKIHDAFTDFVDTLVSLWDGESPLVLIHRNDMFSEAALPLPRYLTVDNYNQAVGRAWGRIRSQGYDAELVYFSTDKVHPVEEKVQNPENEDVGWGKYPMTKAQRVMRSAGMG